MYFVFFGENTGSFCVTFFRFLSCISHGADSWAFFLSKLANSQEWGQVCCTKHHAINKLAHAMQANTLLTDWLVAVLLKLVNNS